MSLPEIGSVADARLALPAWREVILTRVDAGERFGGVYGTQRGDDTELIALLATPSGFESVSTVVRPDADRTVRYPALSTELPAAFWYERAMHDLSGIIPIDHPRLDPLLLPIPPGDEHPRPGRVGVSSVVAPHDVTVPAEVAGHIFPLSFGPVRSGVMESIELLLETPGEDIPYVNVRPHYKHRGIAKQFEGLPPDRGVLVAERVEGISSVAHALAFSHAIECLAGVDVPQTAALLRTIYAELERICNHLDVTMRLCDAAGLAVATARFGWHKESVMRLVSHMCGNRFGRGVVVPGGVTASPAIEPDVIAQRVSAAQARIRSDIRGLESSASFLDRLRGTGPLSTLRAREHGALGPIGRASAFDDDDRWRRPYDAYADLPRPVARVFDSGDAMARARVRWHEIDVACELIQHALRRLASAPSRLSVPVSVSNGSALGWAEAAQGEALYAVEVADGRLLRCFARSASFHNLVLFHDVFAGDIFTDLPFIEASFGLSYAGVAM